GVEEGKHLYRERLIDFQQSNVLDRQIGLFSRLLCCRYRSAPHHFGGHPCEGVGDHLCPRGNVPLLCFLSGDEESCGRAVGQGRGGGGGHPSSRAEGGGQARHSFHRGAGARGFIGGCKPPSTFGIGDS